MGVLALYAAVVVAFWAAPLLAREYEQGTHLLAWSQDVSRTRWLAGKSTLLLAVAVVSAAVLGGLNEFMVGRIHGAVSAAQLDIEPFQPPYFAAAPLVDVGYVLFAFAFGLVLSALIWRTLVAMTGALGTYQFAGVPDHALRVSSGLLDASGHPAGVPRACASGGRVQVYEHCLHQHGVVARYFDFQPPDRIAEFRLIEFGIYVVLAVLLFVGAWRVLRRAGRV